MDTSDQTARLFYEEIKSRPNHAGFGFENKVAILNVGLQKAYTCVDEFKTAYATHPRQLDYINQISTLARAKGLPVIWTHVGYLDSAADAGI